ncbi:STAS domain-containing protein [Chitiniphilus eburneus]|uniref:STAS domain-containing protein n=1 Tax=Chitiniphilus eburneus TaxID=2571148 RepID=A0A4U0QEM1_9NEIS|nr:STAS domain-containing protein [Chitiniphilus eburneus]TJZ79112.1 STAS domain-containing protein [Chitiniphilus eburneus]
MTICALSGVLTLATAARRLDEPVIAGESVTLDLSGVEHADSAALGLLLAWQRRAQAAGTALQIVGAPEGLLQLARVYGVAELLPFSGASA